MLYKIGTRFTGFARRASCAAIFAGLTLALSSCDQLPGAQGIREKGDKFYDNAKSRFESEENDLIDPANKLSRNDYREHFEKQPPEVAQVPQVPQLPDVSQLMLQPSPPIVGNDKLITISVTEDVPLKEVLIELGRKADVDMQIDPGIQGGIIFKAKDRPFSDVIERITQLSGLRYSVDNGVLSIERDMPYIINYRLDFMNQTRTSSSNVNINTQLGGGGGSESSAGQFTSGSTASIQSTTAGNDLWKIVDEGIKNILSSYTAQAQSGGDAAPGAAADPAVALLAVSGAPAGGALAQSTILSLNTQAGVVNILATDRQHRAIQQYLENVKRSVTAQVLIEAKLIEINLSDEYKSGIDWSVVADKISVGGDFRGTTADTALEGSVVSFAVDPIELFGDSKYSLDAAVDFAERFGTSKTLSSPRINAMNNQPAVLTFAENFVYFEVDIENEETTGSTGTIGNTQTRTAESEIKTVPIGVIMMLQPSIDLDRNEITMNIRPTLTEQVGSAEDPAVRIEAAGDPTLQGFTNEVPIVQVRELDTVMRVKSGQVLVIGGLINEKTINTDSGVPILSEIPWVGNAFKKVSKETVLSELVIFIKATIVPTSGVDRNDQEFFKKFNRGNHTYTF